MKQLQLTLHHIGIVVPNCRDAAKCFQSTFQDSLQYHEEFIGSQKVYVCMLQNKKYGIEFIEPMSPESPVSTFINNGGGLHHLCYAVKNLDFYSEFLKAELRPITGPFIGYQNKRCAFFWMKRIDTRCSLIELIEMR